MINLETFLICTAILAALAALFFWGSMAVHCLKNEELSKETRLLWLAVVVFGKLLGAGAYYLMKFRRPAPAQTGA